MSIFKTVKDNISKFLMNKNYIPKEIFDMKDYFRCNGPINFEIKKENNLFIAISKDFRCGSIVTEANTIEDLDKNIKDAILTSFDIPSSYAKEANIINTKDNKVYATA